MFPVYNNDRINVNEEENSSNYLDIWNINPFHKNIDAVKIISRIGFFTILIVAISFFVMIIFSNTDYLIVTILILVILLFYENIINVYYNFWKNLHRVRQVNPFKDLVFWINDPETIVVINKKSSVVYAVRIFKLNILPEYVHPTLNHFLKALYTANIKLSYQIVQTPLIYQKNKLNNSENSETSIYFSIFEAFKGFLTKNRINRLVKKVYYNSKIFKAHLSSNFYHTQISLLSGFSLLNAIRAIFCGIHIDSADFNHQKNQQFNINIHFFIKLLIIAFFVVLFTYFSLYLSFPWFIIVILNIIIIIGLIIVWWEDMKFSISKGCFLKNIDVKAIDPFSDIDFYQIRCCRGSLFMLLENKLLVGPKLFNLKNAFQKCFIYPDKFFCELSGFKKSAQRLLVNAIFQLIRTCSPELDAKKLMHNKDPSQKLKNVIMMDKIGWILAKPKYQNFDDDKTITKHYLEIVFEDFLSAFRSRGIGIILGDHMPSRLFEGVYKLPSIKILFRTDKEDLQKFGLGVEDIMVIDSLKNRFAFIKDGVNSKRFIFYTTDYE